MFQIKNKKKKQTANVVSRQLVNIECTNNENGYRFSRDHLDAKSKVSTVCFTKKCAAPALHCALPSSKESQNRGSHEAKQNYISYWDLETESSGSENEEISTLNFQPLQIVSSVIHSINISPIFCHLHEPVLSVAVTDSYQFKQEHHYLVRVVRAEVVKRKDYWKKRGQNRISQFMTWMISL